MTVLSPRALDRALLARQMLIERHTVSTVTAIERLVGLQSQAPLAPYVGLWSRLHAFDPDTLATTLVERTVVRATLMRATVHLVTAGDALALRPWIEPVVRRGFASSPFARQIAGIDLEQLVSAGRDLLDERPRTNVELGRELSRRWPSYDPASMATAVAYLSPLVQVPPRGVWGTSGPAARAPMTSWLGRGLEQDPSPDAIVLRYLGAFGPATVRDAQAWSGMTRLRDVFERLRPSLITFQDDRGREVFDLPDAPRPDPDTPVPIRFLPEYDNILIGHADRSRIIPPGRSIPLLPGNGAKQGTVLVDGMLAGIWRTRIGTSAATLTIEPFAPIPDRERVDLDEEGTRLLAFIAAGLDPDVVIARPVAT